MKRLMLLAAVAVGYVLGARAGRERYDQIVAMMRTIKSNPRVQATAHQAVDLAKEQAPVVADKVTQAASAAASKVTRHDSAQSSAQSSAPSSSQSANGAHHMAGPQGDLP